MLAVLQVVEERRTNYIYIVLQFILTSLWIRERSMLLYTLCKIKLPTRIPLNTIVITGNDSLLVNLEKIRSLIIGKQTTLNCWSLII